MNSTLKIEIFRGEVVWLAKLSGNSEIWGAFGTDTLPTAFLLQTPAIQVKERLQKLNPKAEIVFLEEVSGR